MDIYQLKTFVTIAKEGSVTRASELLFISQPAVSAHIKAIEDEIGFQIFERTTRGMKLTPSGMKLLEKAENVLKAYQGLIAEAKDIKQGKSHKLRLGSNRSTSAHLLGRLLAHTSELLPDCDISIEYGTSTDIIEAIANNQLDAGFYAHTGLIYNNLYSIAVDHFGVYLAAPPGWVADKQNPDWKHLATLPWLYPVVHSCCGVVAENLFKSKKIHPEKSINVDQEKVTRTLIAGGVGIGFLHHDTALDAAAKQEVELIGDVQQEIPVYFAVSASRLDEPLIQSLLNTIKRLNNVEPNHHSSH